MASEITASQKARFQKAIKELNALMREIQRTVPGANYYLQEDTMNLMSGPSHSGPSQQPIYENIADDARLHCSDGGGW